MPKLDPRPARQLTSREAVKILSGTVGVLVDMAGPDNTIEAIEWIYAHRHHYRNLIPPTAPTPPKGDPS